MEWDHPCCSSELLDDLHTLWVVFRFNRFIVLKSGMFRTTRKLKSSGIKGIFVFLPSSALDHDFASIFGHVLYWSVNSGYVRWPVVDIPTEGILVRTITESNYCCQTTPVYNYVRGGSGAYRARTAPVSPVS